MTQHLVGTTEKKTVETSGVKAPLTLLGLGAMGTALARAWLAEGHPLTVWNRTPARAAALVGEGARAADDAAAAVAANRLVVVCLLDHQPGRDPAGADPRRAARDHHRLHQ
ncbi:NAD(P)-binding domain-containing protein, partial [Streptomyces sp. NPDC001274]